MIETKDKANSIEKVTTENEEFLQHLNLQHKRASILEKHLKSTSEEKAIDNTLAKPIKSDYRKEAIDEKDLEIQRLKAELLILKNTKTNSETTDAQEKEYTKVLDKLLPDFLHEISNPFSSIEYSSQNLQAEYQRILKTFVSFTDSTKDTKAFQRVLNYLNSLVIATTSSNNQETRELKEKFIEQLSKYNLRNPQRAVEYLMASGIYAVDAELNSFITQPNGELLFQLLISFLSAKQSFSLLDTAKSRTRYLITTLKNYTNKLPDNYTEKFDLITSIETAIVLLKHRLKSCNFSFQYNTQCFIEGNIQHIIHVWINIIANAIEATNSKGTISVNVYKENEEVVIAIQDNGSGISDEVRSKIFTPYFTTKKDQGGTGIGLNICKNVITKIGGAIDVSSAPGKTIFYIRINNYDSNNNKL